MQLYLVLAGMLAAIVGSVHSVLGEILIFNRMRKKGSIVPVNGLPLLRQRHVRILWASWHLVTVFGWTISGILFQLSRPLEDVVLRSSIENMIIFGMVVSSALVLFATRGMHPGWIGLIIVAALCSLA